MKYPDINIQIKYPKKLINADTPSMYNGIGEINKKRLT